MGKRKKDPNLEPYLPNGAQRCQARSKSTGQQCKNPAVSGYSVCSVHGAGTRVRVARGERKPPGRPPIHGLYSQRAQATLRALYEEVLALGDLDATDREVAMLKAVVWYLLEGAEAIEARQKALEALFAHLEALAQEEGREARAYAQVLGQIERLMREAQSYLDRLGEAAMRVVTAVRMRADTAAKNAQAKAAQALLGYVDELKAVLLEHLEPEEYEAILEALERRVLLRAAHALPPE
ncbi:hypothetical protein CSW25_07060 [Thermus scotoductus]|uniref:Uncharacterized protein n=3 Tax=Thermus TaxID=270 RepID=A0A430R0E8_THESC|nr:hypothetical protein [Thermus scotoductus]AYJ74784.1 hypothetical protein phiMa_01 [Thermus phage phiMa]RTG93480.1 hypothetical protein CSW49_10650 [Thermus scotoductus]RTH00845.1 hypothetical protein CSW45_12240 [Thermus scotoductus]RTH06773.1 hypothetical protein CSW46_11700 [Thermus scotoductus]RTH08712.1 hypothetical protein CSW44_10960 [Thermus scotoductus]